MVETDPLVMEIPIEYDRNLVDRRERSRFPVENFQ